MAIKRGRWFAIGAGGLGDLWFAWQQRHRKNRPPVSEETKIRDAQPPVHSQLKLP